MNPEPTKPTEYLPPPPRPVAKKLSDLPSTVELDPNAIIGVAGRYICKGAGVLFVGETGAGKSTLEIQSAICWGLGKPIFGLKPAAALRSVIIQAENDERDMAEMRDGVFTGLELFSEQRKQASENVLLVHENSRTGFDFISNVLRPVVEDFKPDLVWIDPLLAYIGADISKQSEVSMFLRNWLNPVIQKHEVACILVHHANKTKQENGKSAKDDMSYYGAGSAELFNWARATLSLRELSGNYELRLNKRWTRSGWATPVKMLARGNNGLLYWRELDEAEVAEQPKTSPEDRAFALIPTIEPIGKETLLHQIVTERIAGTNPARALLKVLLEKGRVFEWQRKRSGTNPQKFIARFAQPTDWKWPDHQTEQEAA